MGFDQARQHDHAAAVDDGGAGRLKILADRDNGTVRDMHVAIGDIARLIHGHYVGVADDEGAAGRQRTGVSGCRSAARTARRGKSRECRRRS